MVLPECNIILKNPGLENFRDPKVIFISDSDIWLMVLACGDHICFYSSKNLKNWSKKGEFYLKRLKQNETIECPNLFYLSVEQVWVLSVSIINTITKESATYYFLGWLKNFCFVPESDKMLPVDEGHDFYAPQVWSIPVVSSNPSPLEAIWIGWFNNWAYANHFPVKEWNGIMSIVRRITVIRNGGVYKLSQRPISTIESLRKKEIRPLLNKNKLFLKFPNPAVYDIKIKYPVSNTKEITLKLSEHSGKKFSLAIIFESNDIVIDRTYSSFPAMRHKNLVRKKFSFELYKDTMDLRLIIDFWTLEFFIFDGTVVISEMVNWKNMPDTLSISGRNINSTALDLNCWELRGAL